MRSSNTGCKTSIVASAVWHVAPSCWNQMLPISSTSIFVNKNSSCWNQMLPISSSSWHDNVAVLLKPNVANILLFNFCEQKFVQHGPIMIANDYIAKVYTTIFVRWKDKLIICQLRHELSVTIHEISTSWKKNVRWRTLYIGTNTVFL